MTGLVNDTAYTFRVRAVNATGAGAASDSVTATPVAAPTAPAKPTGLTAAAGDTEVTLRWNNPGDSSITSYDYSVDSGTWTAVPSSDATTVTYTVTNLTNGTAYTFKVRAVNANGNSPASDSATATPVDPATPTATLVLTPASIDEDGGQTTGVSTVTATLNKVSTAATTLTVSATPGSGTVFNLSANKTLTIAANATDSTGTVTITAVNNTVDAPEKTVTVSATAANSQGVIAPADVTLTITDDEETPTATLVLTPDSITESGGVSTVTAMLDGKSSEATIITVSATADSGTDPGDFTLIGSTLTIAAGATDSAGTVTITAVDNTVDAPEKTVTVSATATNSQEVVAPADVTLTITDDEETPTATLVLTPSSITESGGVSTVTAMLDGKSSEPTIITVTATADSGTDPGDFTLSGSILTIAAGATDSTGTVTITAVDNTVDAPDKTVTVSVTQILNPQEVVAPADVTLTITDDDGPAGIVLSKSSVTVTEAAGAGRTATYTVKLSSEPATDVTVTVVSADTGVATVSSASLTFTDQNWDTAQTLTVTGVDDDIDNDDRSTAINHTATGDYGAASLEVKLTDDEDAPTVTLKLTPASIGENGGISTVTASQSGKSSEATTITVSATADSGTDPGDFILSSNVTLTIAAGATDSTGTVTITAVNNTVDAPEKTVTVSATATNPQEVVAPADVTLTITDDEETPTATLVLTPSSITESGGISTITAMLDGKSSEPTIITVTATADSGTDPGDFTLSGSTLTIAAGATDSTGTVTITAVNNTVDALDKTVTVSVTQILNPQEVVAPADVTLTITDDDGPAGIVLSKSSVTVTEAAGAGRTATYRVALSEAPATDVTVTVVSADTGVATVSSASLTFTDQNWDTAQTLTVTGVDDDIDNDDRSTAINHTATGDYGAASLAVKLTDDEDAPTVTLKLTPASIGENGGVSTVTASQSGKSSEATTITVSATADTGTDPGDFILSSNVTLTIPAGAAGSSGVVTITAVNNTVDAPDKTVTVSVTQILNPQEVVAPADVTLTITDDDAAVTNITLSVSPASLGEADTATDITVTATLAGASTLEMDVTITISLAGTAERGAWKDYTATVANVTIPANMPSGTATLSITPINDTVVEGNETIIVEGTTTVGLSVSPATITLIDNDAVVPEPVTVSVKDVSVKEGDSGTTPLTFTVTLDKASDETVTMDWSTVDGTAKSEEGDYVAGSGGLTFSPGDTTKPITVQVNGDTNVEPDENFQLVLKNLVGAEFPDGGRSLIAHGGILNDDETIAPVGTLIWKESGAPVVGQVRTAKWKDQPLDETPSRSRFYWVVCNADGSGCEDVPEYESGPTYEYTPVVDDVGKVLRAHVFYSFEGKLYKAITEFSRLVAPVAIDAPVDTLIWKESGAPVVGQVRTAKWPGQPLDQPPSRSRFYWVVCNADGSGCVDVPEYASGPTYEYTPVVDDVGKVLQAHVFYSFGGKRYKATTTLSQPVEGVGVQ